jgi:type II secretory pathway pseudopilin PulG
MAIASLVLGILAIPSLGCFLVGAVVAIVLGIVALNRANRDPRNYGGKGFAIGGIVAGALSLVILLPFAIIAAIAIPNLMRARYQANEAMAIGDLRTYISAQAAYQSASGGVYGSLECLHAPSGCIQGYPETAPTFLDGELASLVNKGGYRRSFHPGRATASDMTTPAYESYAVVLEPLQPGRTGRRTFCGDATGVICFTGEPPAPVPVDGACPPPPACRPLP